MTINPELWPLSLSMLRVANIASSGRFRSLVLKTTWMPAVTTQDEVRSGARCGAAGRPLMVRNSFRISTVEPDAEESAEGLQEFVVLSAQVSHIPRGHREPNAQGYMVWVEDE